jgi:hypothetical protein
MQTEMNNFKSYRTWIPADSNTVEGRITLFTVACYLTAGIQADVFSFERDAYLYLADQAEGLTDAQRAELEQLAQSSNYEAFWDLFNQLVRPVTDYRIESHVLQLQRELF